MPNSEIMKVYTEILETELVEATGCTEPIALALAGAKARQVLGAMPDRVDAFCSGNIIKNVKGVVVPNSGGVKGIDTAVLLGMVGGDPDASLQVISRVLDEEHCILDFGQGMYHELNMATGEISNEYTAFSNFINNLTIGRDREEGYYLSDVAGNRLSDYYDDYQYAACVPIFFDKDGNGFALNSQGQIVKELGNRNNFLFEDYDDYILIVTDGEGILYDKDLNEISTSKVFTNNYRYKLSISPATPFLDTGDSIINGLTGEVVIEKTKNIRELIVAKDHVVAEGDSKDYTERKYFHDECRKKCL